MTQPSLAQIWWQAARPKTLFASLCPVAIGTALAWRDHAVHWGAAWAALGGAVAIQIGTNFCNDYCDFVQGADTAERIGPRRAVQAGWITPGAMRTATAVAFLIAAAFSALLVARGGIVFAWIGALSIVSGIAYTAGRYSLAYVGLGDLFVLVCFGPLAVGGTFYAQALHLPPAVLLAGLAPGLLAVNILVVNNLRDIETDRQARKRTLAVRLGPAFARGEYLACLLGAAAVPWGLRELLAWPTSIVWVSLSLLPGVVLFYRVLTQDGERLNPLLGKTAALLLIYTVAFCGYCVLR